MVISYGLKSLTTEGQYANVAELLNDTDLSVVLGRPENTEVLINGEVCNDSSRHLTDMDRVEFVTKANKKG